MIGEKDIGRIVKQNLLTKAAATQTKTSSLKQHSAGERVCTLDDYNVPARTLIEKTGSS